MKVWEIGVSDAESCTTILICATKEIAVRELFKKRDELISEWKEMKVQEEKDREEFIAEKAAQGVHFGFGGDGFRDMWGDMIKALSSDDYEKWDNYPHETLWIAETEVLDK